MQKLPYLLPVLLCLAAPGFARAQRAVTLNQAVREALSRTPRIAIVRADSADAEGQLIGAREYPNPALALGYSKSTPLWHFELEQSFEYPSLRAARVRAARTHLRSTTQLLAAERAAVRYDVEVAYVQAASAQAISQLSERNAREAQDLLRITQARQAAGDASELDVHVASVFSGQAQNAAFADSLAGITTVLTLQGLLGLQRTDVEIALADSLETLLPETEPTAAALRIVAAQSQLRAQQANVDVARRSRWPAPALRAGFETGDPSGSEKGLLPTIGISLPLPILNWNRGQVSQASAQAARAQAELQLVELETRTALAVAEKDRDITRLKVERGRAIVQEAERVATLANTAYREGAYTLASVLEAQRSAREALRQFIEDLAASRIAEFALVRARTVGGALP